MMKILAIFIVSILLVGCTQPAGLASTHEECLNNCRNEYCASNPLTGQIYEGCQITPILETV